MAMVFGNMGENSATGVAMTRNSTTGEKDIEGDYLTNAQGEDVVAGIRMTKDINQLIKEMPEAYAEFLGIAKRLELHYRDMQDMEFTIERGKLWMLQTRNAKRSAQAAVRIATDMAEEKLITREEAVLRVSPEQVDFFMHPQFDHVTKQEAKTAGSLLATGSTCRRGRRWAWWPSTPIWPNPGARGIKNRSSWSGRRPSPTTCTACWRPRAS